MEECACTYDKVIIANEKDDLQYTVARRYQRYKHTKTEYVSIGVYRFTVASIMYKYRHVKVIHRVRQYSSESPASKEGKSERILSRRDINSLGYTSSPRWNMERSYQVDVRKWTICKHVLKLMYTYNSYNMLFIIFTALI